MIYAENQFQSNVGLKNIIFMINLSTFQIQYNIDAGKKIIFKHVLPLLKFNREG